MCALPTCLRRLQLTRLLWRSCQVYKAILNGYRPVAAKFIAPVVGPLSSQKRLVREVGLLKYFADRNSPYLVQFLGATLIGNQLVIVTELMKGDLFNALGNDDHVWGPK